MPDEATWLRWGTDLTAAGFEPVAAPERAEVVVLPERLPPELAEAVAAAMGRAPRGSDALTLPSPVPGVPAEHVGHADHTHGEHADDAHAHHAAHGGHDGDDEHGEHDHHDMMAIVGDPSRDGLVMESIDFELGPLSPGLPTGLIVELSLDGDVIASARPRASLSVPAEEVARGAPADPLTPLTWRAARAQAAPAATRIEAIEVERALSHAAWLRSLGFVLGWKDLGDAALRLARLLLPARNALADSLDAERRTAEGVDLEDAADSAQRLMRLLERSRFARARLRGRAVVETAVARELGLDGPVARAAGVADDARSADPAYEALGFEALVEDGGDAYARTLLRGREAVSAVQLALAAAAAGAPGGGTPDALAIEGPRGPVPPQGDREALLTLAGSAVVGLELAAATIGLVSFDLSPWRARG